MADDDEGSSSLLKTGLKVAGFAATAAAGVAGTAYVAQRALARSLDHRPDPDAGKLGPPRFDEARRLPSHDGGSIYTISRGAGPTILLSHGVTLTSQVWTKQLRDLPEDGFRVVAFDHRGHGESTVGSEGHSIASVGRDIGTVLSELDLTGTIVVGHSMGGMGALELAVHHAQLTRERVAGLVLLCTASKTQISARRRLRTIAERLSERFTLGSVMSHNDLGTLLARIGFGREPLASHVELTRELLATCGPETSKEAVQAIFGFDVSDQLERVRVPTLVIGGEQDRVTPAGESRHMAERIPGARLVLLEGAGHMVMLERSDELRSLLLEFAHEVGVRHATSP